MTTAKPDRIFCAWMLRQRIHAYLKANVGSLMEDIIAAMPDINAQTIRQSIKRLRKDLDVVMVNTRGGNIGRYSAVTREIRSVEETRARLRESGRKNVHHAHAGFIAERTKQKAEREAKNDPATLRHRGPRIDPERPWVTRHECGDTAPAHGSRGQCAARQRVHVNCFQLF